MSDDDQEQYLMALALSFGAMDPCDWAAMLSAKLLEASLALRRARDHHEDQSKDITQFSEADSLSDIRNRVGEYLAQVFEMLNSMPMIQSQPDILESLRFIIAAIVDIDRGNRAEWLGPIPTKKHPKRLSVEAQWIPVIAALQLLLNDPRYAGVHSAAKEIARQTNRKLGTIKYWYRKLAREGKIERSPAWMQILQEDTQIRSMLNLIDKSEWAAIIERRVNQLLS